MTERNADVSKTLTEQFKKGALLCGWYWCECYNEEIKLLYYDGDSFELDDPETKNYYFFLPKDVKEITVLSPVPTYDEYQELLSDQLAKNEGVEINAELEERLKKTQKLELNLRKENAQLKKWCEEFNALEVANENAELKSKLQLKETAYDFDTARLEEENEKLKGLLKECQDEIEYLRKHYKGNIDHFKNNTRLDKEISQVLGEE